MKHVALLLAGLLMASPVLAVDTPPLPSAPRPVTYPTPVERTLANGLRVIVVPRRNVPLIAAALLIKSGSEADPTERSGLAELTAELLTQGTATRTAQEIAQSTDALGANLDAGAGWDASQVSVSATTPKFSSALDLFADVVLHPAFSPAEIARTQTRKLSDLQLAYSQPSSLARLVAARVLFGDAPYGHPSDGTPTSLQSITQPDLVNFHRTYFRPDNAILIIGGDITPDAAFQEAQRIFGDWQAPNTPLPTHVPASAAPGKPRVVVVDLPDAGRTAIVVGRIAIPRSDPNYYAAVVANNILSGYSGRLNTEVRIKRGLSYSAGTQVDARREAGPFYAMTLVDNKKAAEGATVVLDTVTGFAKQPVESAELVSRKAVATGGFARSLESIGGLVGRVGYLSLYEIPLSEINAYIPKAEAITPVQVQQFAAANLSKDLSVILVGNAKLFLADLRKSYPQVEVISASKLDLGQPGLKK
ncbi:MAG: insulinase family protein [Anaerolineae bacterium]|nr:insulinase family protein [Gloeobacterales cyanobacterium ES-bin-313]